jgi:type II secretory pathway pseudopilin PulG
MMKTQSAQNSFRPGAHASRITHPAFPSALRTPHSELLRAFTMIEIAISLAVIGFALVAIIGILPAGMSTQKDNRQETIIAQDESVLMEAFRNGARGMDDLTNYVFAITNTQTHYNVSGGVVGTATFFYTYTSSTPISQPNGGTVPFLLTNGSRIIGLLGTPKIIPLVGPQNRPLGVLSNHTIAYVRSLSGPASEKFPQTNSSVQDLALSYRIIVDVSPYSTNYFNPDWTNWRSASTTNEALIRSNFMVQTWYFQTNLHDLRLIFRWPLQVSNPDKQQRQVFRTTVSGSVLNTNDFGYPLGVSNLYFFQPRTFVKAL